MSNYTMYETLSIAFAIAHEHYESAKRALDEAHVMLSMAIDESCLAEQVHNAARMAITTIARSHAIQAVGEAFMEYTRTKQDLDIARDKLCQHALRIAENVTRSRRYASPDETQPTDA